MGNLLKIWIFFTALLIFLITAAVTLPNLTERFWGDTEQKLQTTFADLGEDAESVWAELTP